jgi:hypothetical protein
MKRVLPFLLLNVVLSAAAMLSVLLIWQARHPLLLQTATPLTDGPPAVLSTPSGKEYADQSVEIQNVIGGGDLNFEAVTLKNTGKAAVDLSGWSLKSQNGQSFVFPSFTVFEGGAFQVFSRSGVNTSLDLYWGSTEPLWISGAKVLLFDPTDTLRQEYLIP